MVNFWEIVRRSETGPQISEKDFDTQYLSIKIKELKKEYDIYFDSEVIIPNDDQLADRVWKAGIDLLLQTGVYHTQTRRCIKFSIEEIMDELEHLPKQIILGDGEDQVTVTARSVEDPKPPIIYAGPTSAPISEEMFVKVNQAYAQEPLIDVLFNTGRIERIEGTKLRVNSALEVQAIHCYAEWTHMAQRRAGRPKMPLVSVAAGIIGLNEIGVSDPEIGLKRNDPRIVMFLPELKIDDVNLSKAAHYNYYGSPIYCMFDPIIGGVGGDPATTAIIGVAYHLAARLIFKASIVHYGAHHIMYTNMSNPHSLFTSSLAGQAVSRNAKFLRSSASMTAASAPDPQIYYETAALALASVSSGSDLTGGPRASQTKFDNHVSPLVARFYGEIGHAITGLPRTKANEICIELLAKYRDTLSKEKAPIGKPFEELYDLKTLIPKPDHLEMYETAKTQISDLGVPLD